MDTSTIANYEKDNFFPFYSVEKRYCALAEAYARKVIGDTVFEYAFAEGQKLSLDDAMDLALKWSRRCRTMNFT